MPTLFSLPTPPAHDLVDLRCCDCAALVADLRSAGEVADLVVADPPWRYAQLPRATATADVETHYPSLSTDEIAEHVDAAAAVGRRLALWVTSPLLGEWVEAAAQVGAADGRAGRRIRWGSPITAGAWVKPDHVGIGYHWLGTAELVLLYARTARGGKPYNDRSQLTRSGHIAPVGQHSAKPIGWMTDWVRRWVRPGGLVLDLYAGTASVAAATLLAGEGRRYVGAEIDPARHERAQHLLAQVRR